MFAPLILMQAAVPATSPLGVSPQMANLVLIGGMFVLFYFLMIRPQQKKAKEHRAMIMAVKRGDTVVLSSGVIGKVVRVEEAEIGIEIATGVTVKAVKAMIADVRVKGTPAAANDAKS
jgi:preprotein translocase subunit YajC